MTAWLSLLVDEWDLHSIHRPTGITRVDSCASHPVSARELWPFALRIDWWWLLAAFKLCKPNHVMLLPVYDMNCER